MEPFKFTDRAGCYFNDRLMIELSLPELNNMIDILKEYYTKQDYEVQEKYREIVRRLKQRRGEYEKAREKYDNK